MIKFTNAPGSRGSWAVASLRVKYQVHRQPVPVRDAHTAAELLRESWDQELINVQEQVGALYLNTREEAIGFRQISTGKLNTSQLDTSLLLSFGLLVRAKSIILCHNHPSGDPTPSRTDIRMTLQLAKSIELVGMELYDHLILVADGYHSMADERNFLPTRLMDRR
jgi:DNA repair protein RadC